MSTRRYGSRSTSYPTIKTPHRASRFSRRLSTDNTWSDLFCGGGGSTEGLKRKRGAKVAVAANHSEIAIRSHEANHPDTVHVCADITAADPRDFPSTRWLWASPECTWHSPAGGRKRPTLQQTLWTEWEPRQSEQAERSRVTMWDVVRFTECHGYDGMVVENVAEVTDWPLFESWWTTITVGLGYEGRKVSLNSMFCWPTPLT